MSVNKLFDVTQFQGDNVAVLRQVLDKIAHDALTFKFTTVLPTAENVNYHEVVIYDPGTSPRKVCVKSGKGELICFYAPAVLGPGAPVTVVTGPTYTALTSDYVILATGPVTITLYDAVANDAKTLYIKRMTSGGANTVIIDGQGAQTIDGALTQTLNVRYASVQLYAGSGVWHII
jgi:Ca2+-binding RTX toxin-like protein